MLRDDNGNIKGIVEYKDATEEEQKSRILQHLLLRQRKLFNALSRSQTITSKRNTISPIP